MTESLEYIDQYFTGEMNASEKLKFEARCQSDEEFAKQVAFYLSARASIQTEADIQMKEEFHELYRERSNKKQRGIRQLYPHLAIAAAAAVILYFGWYLFTPNTSVNQLVDRYVQDNLQTMSPSMGAATDSMELGKTAFNEKRFSEAAAIFQRLAVDEQRHATAVEALGVTYLAAIRYDEAVAAFEVLAADSTLHINNGPFFQAIALIKRGHPGDRHKARRLLELVVKTKMLGEQEARRWLITL